MKVLLGCLMCLVLTIAQTFAISGGPWGGRGQVTVAGIYAGVLVPIPPVNPAPPPPTLPPDNSLALFTITIPKTGLATGTSATFRNGNFYPGTLRGSADPDSAKLTAIINASFTVSQREVTGATIITDPVTGVTLTDFTTSNVTHTYQANGQFDNTKIVATQNSFATSSTRIRGKASITYTTDAHDPSCTPNEFSTPPVTCPVDPAGDSGGPIEYKVRGFKQAELSS